MLLMEQEPKKANFGAKIRQTSHAQVIPAMVAGPHNKLAIA